MLQLNSLRFQISLLVLIIFIPNFLLTLITAVDQEELTILEAQEDALAYTDNIAMDNQQYIKSTQMLLTALAQLPEIREKRVNECNELLGRMLAEYPIYTNIFLVDISTNSSICRAVSTGQTVSNITADWYLKTLEERRFTIGGYRIGAASGKPILPMAMPVFDANNELTAVVAASLSLEWLEESIRTTEFPSDITLTLIDNNGTVLARYPEIPEWVGQSYSNRQVATAVVTGQRGAVRALDHTGEPRLYGYSQADSGEGQMFIIIGMLESEVFAGVDAIRDRNLFILGGLTLIAILLSVSSSRLITRPIKILTENSLQIATGNLNTRPPLYSDITELQDLLAAFNRMIDALQKNAVERMNEMEVSNVRLQSEIVERIESQERTRILQELAASLSEAVTTEQVCEIVIHKGLVPIGSDIAIITRFDHETSQVVMAHGIEQLPDALLELTRQPEAIWQQDCACLPLLIGKKVTGSLLFKFKGSADKDFRQLARTIADYCAQALERAKLFETEKEARESAEQANRMKMQFLGMISHELRTPLTSIKGFITTLLANDVTFSEEEQRLFLSIAEEEADKLTGLIDQLLNLTRLQSGTMPIHPEITRFEEVLRVAQAELNTLTQNHKLQITLPPDLPLLRIDTDRIAQVMVNLVGNAAKFSPTGSIIRIEAARREQMLEVKVSDQGIGVPPDAHDHIFEAFRQVDRKDASQNKGAGLGLAICKGLVEAHRGTIHIEDAHPCGAVFIFTLPLA